MSEVILAAIESLRKEMNEKTEQSKKEVVETIKAYMEKIEDDVNTLKIENIELKEKKLRNKMPK